MLAPFAVAAVVLCVAAVAKLRAPKPAASALAAIGVGRIPVIIHLIRLFAVGELVVGLWALAAPSRSVAVVLAVAYAGFAVVALVLSRRGASCGCFGVSETSASPLQAAISAALSFVCAWVAVRGPHGIGWVFDRSAAQAGVLTLGIVTAAYATVVAYTELPGAWSAWSGR